MASATTLSWRRGVLYHGAAYAVVDAAAKVVAAGARYDKMRYSSRVFRAHDQVAPYVGQSRSRRARCPKMQVELGLPSIGGKDSMSGTFEQINVPPNADGLRYYDCRCRTRHLDRFQEGGPFDLPSASYPARKTICPIPGR